MPQTPPDSPPPLTFVGQLLRFAREHLVPEITKAIQAAHRPNMADYRALALTDIRRFAREYAELFAALINSSPTQNFTHDEGVWLVANAIEETPALLSAIVRAGSLASPETLDAWSTVTKVLALRPILELTSQALDPDAVRTILVEEIGPYIQQPWGLVR